MANASARAARQPCIKTVRFYKMDHRGDPVPLRNGRIRLGGNDCKAMLRSGIGAADLTGDNLIIAIGGVTAKDGLADRVCWGGILVTKEEDGHRCIECEDGFYLAQRGPLDWREQFPAAARFVRTVHSEHRVNIPQNVRDEFIQMHEWCKGIEARQGRTPAPGEPEQGRCPSSPCPPRKRGGPC